MPKFVDLSNRRFGRLLIVDRNTDKKETGGAWWNCLCDCGNKATVRRKSLLQGSTKSCGCFRKDFMRTQRLEETKTRHSELADPLSIPYDATRFDLDCFLNSCCAPLKTGETVKTTKNYAGYVFVVCPKHPNADSRNRIMVHQLVVSHVLGRALLANENVHHKNGVRDDNRPENLELWNTFQPRGQRPDEKVVWAEEILRLYAPHKLK